MSGWKISSRTPNGHDPGHRDRRRLPEYPFAEVNPPTPDAADIAQAERRKRAMSHPAEDVPE